MDSHRLPDSGASAVSTPGKLHVFTKGLFYLTLGAIALGATVTSTESGMADPQWPSFGGKLLPSIQEMAEDRGKLYEHTHRVIAGLALIATWVMAIVLVHTPLRDPRRSVRRLVWSAALVGLAPATLGGLTVLLETPPWTSVIHVGLASLFLSLNCALAVVTGRRWAEVPEPTDPGDLEELRWLYNGAIACLVSVYVQLLLGGILRHAYAGAMTHILFGFVAFAVILTVIARVFGRHARRRDLVGPALVLTILLIAEFFLGFTAYVTRPEGVDDVGSDLHVFTATVHQIFGVVMVVASVVLVMRAGRWLRLTAAAAPPERATAGETSGAEVGAGALGEAPSSASVSTAAEGGPS